MTDLPCSQKDQADNGMMMFFSKSVLKNKRILYYLTLWPRKVVWNFTCVWSILAHKSPTTIKVPSKNTKSSLPNTKSSLPNTKGSLPNTKSSLPNTKSSLAKRIHTHASSAIGKIKLCNPLLTKGSLPLNSRNIDKTKIISRYIFGATQWSC